MLYIICGCTANNYVCLLINSKIKIHLCMHYGKKCGFIDKPSSHIKCSLIDKLQLLDLTTYCIFSLKSIILVYSPLPATHCNHIYHWYSNIIAMEPLQLNTFIQRTAPTANIIQLTY